VLAPQPRCRRCAVLCDLNNFASGDPSVSPLGVVACGSGSARECCVLIGAVLGGWGARRCRDRRPMSAAWSGVWMSSCWNKSSRSSWSLPGRNEAIFIARTCCGDATDTVSPSTSRRKLDEHGEPRLLRGRRVDVGCSSGSSPLAIDIGRNGSPVDSTKTCKYSDQYRILVGML
jgi:hypothetical protein